MQFIFKNIISGKTFKLKEMQQSVNVNNIIEASEYIIKNILSSLNLDKFGANVIKDIRDSWFYEDDYNAHAVYLILNKYTTGNVIFTPYGSAINSNRMSFFNSVKIEIDFSNNSFPWLGYDIKEAYEEIGELKEAGQLFTEDIYEPYIDNFKDRPTVVKALCLHIAHDCNLACKYCFAEEGEYHGRRALMSYEVGKKALDFLVANSGSRKNLEVDFFGGKDSEKIQRRYLPDHRRGAGTTGRDQRNQ
jgi:sulfatase maturation enzyme AslB (radical SAM superfamily)